MNTINTLRTAAQMIIEEPEKKYKLVVTVTVGNKTYESCKMFGISKERAEEYAQYYKGAKVVEM